MSGPPSLTPSLKIAAGLCATCAHAELKASARSVFLRCLLAESDPRLPRYPELPVVACVGWRLPSAS